MAVATFPLFLPRTIAHTEKPAGDMLGLIKDMSVSLSALYFYRHTVKNGNWCSASALIFLTKIYVFSKKVYAVVVQADVVNVHLLYFHVESLSGKLCSPRQSGL